MVEKQQSPCGQIGEENGGSKEMISNKIMGTYNAEKHCEVFNSE